MNPASISISISASASALTSASALVVVGMPVGFVGAVDAKAALRVSGLPSVSNRSGKGGAAVAAAAVNALLYEGMGLYTEARAHEPAAERASLGYPGYPGCRGFLGCRQCSGFVERT